MGQKVSTARAGLGLWPRDVTPDRSTARHGRLEAVQARTEVSNHTNVGRNEITVVPRGTVEGHSALNSVAPCRSVNKSVLTFYKGQL